MSEIEQNAATAPAVPGRRGVQLSDFIAPEHFRDCVHCGLCIPSCPTFLELGTEMDSPRGRLQLMGLIHDGSLELDDRTIAHFDGCLGCRACETVCPAGVRYGEMIEGTRHFIEERYTRPFSERWKRRLINRVFPSTWMMRQLRKVVWIIMALRLNRLKKCSWLPAAVRESLRYLPERGVRFRSSRLSRKIPPRGRREFRVGLLSGCVMEGLFGETQENTAELLRQNGCEIHLPAGVSCCGALLLHNGERERGLALARKTVKAFDRLELDAIITTAAGCGATMKEYGAHLANEPEVCDAAARISAKVQDIAEFLSHLTEFEPKRGIAARVTYHDACHLLNGQGVFRQPRDLIRKIPNVELVELDESEICCGSAGTYNLTQPELAKRLGERKARCVEATAADTVVTGNPGCMMQMRAALQDRGAAIKVVHTADLLAQAYARGPEDERGHGSES